jgi:carbon-monoxide dehydrogenase large subunit
VLTDADLDKHIASLQCPAPIPNLRRPVFSALATDKVRMMGNPVALVLATTRAEAEDAVEAIDVGYEPLEVVATIEHARTTAERSSSRRSAPTTSTPNG